MKLQTPFYVIVKDELEKSFTSLKDSLERYWDNYIIGYSYKTNSLPWIIKYFQKQGCYAEVVSDDEYELAKLIHTDLKCIIYNGPIKTKESFLEALKNGCYVNIDSQREISWLDALDPKGLYKIGLRVNFDIEKDCPSESSGGEKGGRFGFCYENGELKKAIECIKNKGFSVKGLHVHISSKTRSIGIYKASSKKICEIVKRYGLELDYVDIGGGYFGGLKDKPQFTDYFKIVSQELVKVVEPKHTTLIVEPGMSLIGPPISYVTSVIDVKDTTYGRFVVTDGSRTSIDPLMRKSEYFYDIRYLEDAIDVLPTQTVVGYTCMEDDRMFELRDEKKLSVGDKIIYNKVGAYTMCLTPLFIKYFPDVYVKDGDDLIRVREKWTPVNYMQASTLK